MCQYLPITQFLFIKFQEAPSLHLAYARESNRVAMTSTFITAHARESNRDIGVPNTSTANEVVLEEWQKQPLTQPMPVKVTEQQP